MTQKLTSYLTNNYSYLIDMSTIIDITNMLYTLENRRTLPDYKELRDCLSSGQLLSKAWLIDELLKFELVPDKLNILIVGGWFGILARMLVNHPQLSRHINKITSVDIDYKCAQVASLVNRAHPDKFEAITQDMLTREYTSEDHIVINTSCEHIPKVYEWSDLLPKSTLVVAQSNDAGDIEDHVSCVQTPVQLEKWLKLSTTLFLGSYAFPMYTRHMVIGIK